LELPVFITWTLRKNTIEFEVSFICSLYYDSFLFASQEFVRWNFMKDAVPVPVPLSKSIHVTVLAVDAWSVMFKDSSRSLFVQESDVTIGVIEGCD